MKKRLMVLLLAACLVLSATACNKKDEDSGKTSTENVGNESGSTENGSTDAGTATDETTEPTTVLDKLSGKAVLGEYKGVEVTKMDTSATEEEIQAELDTLAFNNAEETEFTGDRTTVELWDNVNINYAGKVDGVAFDGGTDDSEEGTDLILGSGSFIPGFEEQVVGFTVGEEKDITVTFPETYHNVDLAGKEAVFTVKVNSIVSTYAVPELTDTFIAENTDYATVDEYKQYVKENIEAANETAAENQIKTDAVQAVIDNATFEGMSEEDVNSYRENMKAYYASMASYYGLDEESFALYFFGLTADKYAEELQLASEFAIKQELVVKAIIEAENLTVSDEEYQTGLTEYATEYGYESAETFEAENTKPVIEEAILMDKALQIIYDNMIVK